MNDISEIQPRMPVVAADGKVVGLVSAVGPGYLTLTSVKDGCGFDHAIPLSWVAEVGKYVFLSKASRYVAANWEDASVALSPRARPKAA